MADKARAMMTKDQLSECVDLGSMLLDKEYVHGIEWALKFEDQSERSRLAYMGLIVLVQTVGYADYGKLASALGIDRNRVSDYGFSVPDNVEDRSKARNQMAGFWIDAIKARIPDAKKARTARRTRVETRSIKHDIQAATKTEDQPKGDNVEAVEYINLGEAATIAGVKTADIKAAIEAGDIAGSKDGRKWKIERASVEEFATKPEAAKPEDQPEDSPSEVVEEIMAEEDSPNADDSRYSDEDQPEEDQPAKTSPKKTRKASAKTSPDKPASVESGSWLTTKEVAEILGGINPASVNDLRSRGRLESTLEGGKRLYDPASVEAYRASKGQRATSPKPATIKAASPKPATSAKLDDPGTRQPASVDTEKALRKEITRLEKTISKLESEYGISERQPGRIRRGFSTIGRKIQAFRSA